MPSPNVGNKKQTPDTSLDFGAKLARRRSQDFKSKIEGWNDAGPQAFADSSAPDEIVVVKEPSKVSEKDLKAHKGTAGGTGGGEKKKSPANNQRAKSPATPPKPAQKTPGSGKKTAREIDVDRKAWVRKRAKTEPEITDEIKRATTPKKRVVDDGNWIRERPKPRGAATPEKTEAVEVEKAKDVTPKPTVIRRSVASFGLKVPPSTHDFVERPESDPIRLRRRASSRSRSRSRERRATTEDTWESFYNRHKKTPTPTARNPRNSDSSLAASSAFDKPSASTDITTPCPSPTKETAARPSATARERSRTQPAKPKTPVQNEAKPNSRPKTAEQTRRDTKPRHASDTAAILQPAPVYNSRIDGWLAGMSDPFSEDTKSKSEDLERKERSSRSKLPPINTSRHRRTHSPTDTADVSIATTPTLRRNGARRVTHSPVKGRYASHTDSGRNSRAFTERTVDLEARRDPVPSNTHSESTDTFADIMRRSREPRHDTAAESLEGGGEAKYGSSLKRRRTKHSDLMSVLSAPRERSGRLKSARSIRSKSPGHDASIAQIMNEVTSDELKYQRELRTLVDGVIPVLLTYVLQKNDPSGGKRLFSGSSKNGQAITRPIVEMGVALERLKSMHKRIPLHDANDLLQWAASAAKAYEDYLDAWRLDFEDIVVNLAPADDTRSKSTSSWETDLPRNQQGELETGKGERANVAYLMKRPLVRIKAFSTTFKDLRDSQLGNSSAADMSTRYAALTSKARKRSNEEKARIEDEAAASIDPTKARDPRTLVPLSGVVIDPVRTVRARDYFDLDLVHSSGQQLDCKVELIVRDDTSGRGLSGDILFCQISDQGRWLLFPPIPMAFVSSRKGDSDNELIVMIRGMSTGDREWRELISLRTLDHEAVLDWRDMLGTSPVPSKLARKSSFNLPKKPVKRDLPQPAVATIPESPTPLVAKDIEVPIGEPAKPDSRLWDASEVQSVFSESIVGGGDDRYEREPISPAGSVDSYERIHARYQPQQRRYDAHRSRPGTEQRPTRVQSSDWQSRDGRGQTRTQYSVWLPQSQAGTDPISGDEDDLARNIPMPKTVPRDLPRPSGHSRMSSAPSTNLPTIPKLRPTEPHPSTPVQGLHQRSESTPNARVTEPSSAPPKMQDCPFEPTREPVQNVQARPASSYAPKSPASGLRSSIVPALTPNFLKRERRSSSPLKHQYAPGSDTESSSEHERSDLDDYDDIESISSESSIEHIPEVVSVMGDLKGFHDYTKRQTRQASPKRLSPAIEETFGPSDSASQGPYRTVSPGGKHINTVASIFAWADRGSWDSLHPQECCVVVSPGLIEAFDLAQAAAVTPADGEERISPSQRGVKPLIALELTPLVPLRRGTAVDISIRSPPTANSLIRTGNNVMFRSRSPEECESLYGLLNRARIDNPTYIALQNARGPPQTSNWAAVMDRDAAARIASQAPSWWNFGSRKGSTYRSKGVRSASTVATESSVGTLNSGASALRRFTAGNRIFNIAKSTLTSKDGTRSTNSGSLSSGAATPFKVDPRLGTPMGITNMKIRVYLRESASKWIDLGTGRLTVMLPTKDDPAIINNPKATGSEKRVLVLGKTDDQVVLDVVLGEQCFERIARTGIAVSVYEESQQIGATGGVNSAKTRVFMLQTKSEREAAYTFGLVGKLRY